MVFRAGLGSQAEPATLPAWEVSPHVHALPDVRSHNVLPDGRELILRTVRPSDAALLQAGFHALGPDSRYRRFLAPKVALSGLELRALTELDGVTQFALGVTTWDHEAHEVPLGIARYVRTHAADEAAEAAITVVDSAQGRGLGRLLLGALIRAAVARGVHFFRAEVASDNRAVHALLRSFDPNLRVRRRAHGVEELELALCPLLDAQRGTRWRKDDGRFAQHPA